MRNENEINEIKSALKKIQCKNRTRTILFIGVGITIVLLGIIFMVLKLKGKWFLDDDDFEEDYDGEHYTDLSKNNNLDDEDEEYEDNYALDYEEE